MVTSLEPGKALSQDARPPAQLKVLPSVVTWWGCLYVGVGVPATRGCLDGCSNEATTAKGGRERRGEEQPL